MKPNGTGGRNNVDGKGWLYDYLRKTQNSVISLLDLKENMNFLNIGAEPAMLLVR